jgi:hypothetical protein
MIDLFKLFPEKGNNNKKSIARDQFKGLYREIVR